MVNLSELRGGPDIFCSELSLEMGESMAGSATPIDAWFLLEYTGVWEAKATDDNDLPRPVQEWLNEQLILMGNGRVQFIRQSRPVDATGISFFVVLSREVTPLLYHFQLNDYEELLKLDLSTIRSGDGDYDDFLRSDPLYLVCTNGKRDRCCARVGVTLFQALAGRVGDAVWQSTHLGGHRFAPTLVTFPDGAFYGRLTPADLDAFVTAQQRGELYLDNLRGRCCYDKVTQAAEQFLRQKTKMRQRRDVRLLDEEPLDEASWAVSFRAPAEGETHRIILTREMSPAERIVSCSPLKAKPVAQFRFISHEIVEG